MCVCGGGGGGGGGEEVILVGKIHPFIQEIGCRQAIFQQSEPSRDLENGVKVTKI